MNTNYQEKTLRTSSRYWLQEIGAIFLFMIILPIFGIYYWGERFYVIGVLGLIVGIPYLVTELLATRKRLITFSTSEITVKIGKETVQQSWKTIQAVKFSGKGVSRNITLFGQEQNLYIPCKYFNEIELTNFLKEYLPLDVFQPKAYQKTQQFLNWQDSVYKRISSLDRTLKVSLGKSERVIGIFGICMGVFTASIFYFSAKDNSGALFMGTLFGGLGLFLLILSLGWIEGDNESITVRTLFMRHEFFWSKLQEIYVESNRGVTALVCDENRLILPSVTHWSGKDKELLFELVSFKLEASKIEAIENGKILYWRSKNF
jgi:hypothetical protein